MTSLRFAIVVGLTFGAATSAGAQEPAAAPPPAAADAPAVEPGTTAPADELSIEQARLADRFKRLEEVVGRLAELSASTDPRRAKLLRDAIAQSREQDINVRFESIVKLLENERLSAAANNQSELQKELDGLLSLLLKADRDKELSSQRDRVRKYLKEVARLIRLQKGIRARTESGDEFDNLQGDQQQVAKDTGKLGGDIETTDGKKKEDGDKKESAEANDTESKSPDAENDSEKKNEQSKQGGSLDGKESKSGDAKSGEQSKSGDPKSGKPSESQPSESQPSESGESKPSESQQPQGQPGQPGQPNNGDENQQPPRPQDPADRAANRLQAAQQQMEKALEKLKEAERKGAGERQREALKELEQAKAELERVLRQLREEEMERTLMQLVGRFRKMLELQNAVYEGTVRLDHVAQAERDHDDEIEAARLSRQESQIAHEADKALLLLREEGTSVAFPEAVEQMRDDMQQVVERLAAVKVESITQGLEQDIIAALEETIAALEKAIKDLDKKKARPGQSPSAGQPAEPPLVEKLAELRMIRSLQVRIYKRTQRYGEMIEGEQAETEELLEALKGLAERQQRVYQATADLERGAND